MVSVKPEARAGVIVNCVLSVLAIVGVVLRFISRLKMKSTPKQTARLQADDWTVLVALVCDLSQCTSYEVMTDSNPQVFTLGVCVTGVWAACTHILGVPPPFMPAEDWVTFRKVSYLLSGNLRSSIANTNVYFEDLVFRYHHMPLRIWVN
jgi:hypothetical protein